MSSILAALGRRRSGSIILRLCGGRCSQLSRNRCDLNARCLDPNVKLIVDEALEFIALDDSLSHLLVLEK